MIVIARNGGDGDFQGSLFVLYFLRIKDGTIDSRLKRDGNYFAVKLLRQRKTLIAEK